jgi:hypothetical protein
VLISAFWKSGKLQQMQKKKKKRKREGDKTQRQQMRVRGRTTEARFLAGKDNRSGRIIAALLNQ